MDDTQEPLDSARYEGSGVGVSEGAAGPAGQPGLAGTAEASGENFSSKREHRRGNRFLPVPWFARDVDIEWRKGIKPKKAAQPPPLVKKNKAPVTPVKGPQTDSGTGKQRNDRGCVIS